MHCIYTQRLAGGARGEGGGGGGGRTTPKYKLPCFGKPEPFFLMESVFRAKRGEFFEHFAPKAPENFLKIWCRRRRRKKLTFCAQGAGENFEHFAPKAPEKILNILRRRRRRKFRTLDLSRTSGRIWGWLLRAADHCTVYSCRNLSRTSGRIWSWLLRPAD